MQPLTARQQKFYNTIIAYVRKNFRWPTYSELASRLDLSSENSVTQYYKALVEKEYLRQDRQGHYTFTNPADVWLPEQTESTTIPILGEISAGSLNEAIEADLGEITLSDFFPHAQSIFGLRVRGMSMKGLGLSTGDTVILSKTELRDGDIGAVNYNGETTLKRARLETDGIRLEPANPDFDDIKIAPGEFEEVTVIGKYLGHLSDDGFVRAPGR